MFLHTENMVSFNLSLQPANFGSQFWLARLSPHFGDESPIFLGFGWCNRFFSWWTIWTTPQVLLGQNVLNLHFYCLGPLKSPVFLGDLRHLRIRRTRRCGRCCCGWWPAPTNGCWNPSAKPFRQRHRGTVAATVLKGCGAIGRWLMLKNADFEILGDFSVSLDSWVAMEVKQAADWVWIWDLVLAARCSDTRLFLRQTESHFLFAKDETTSNPTRICYYMLLPGVSLHINFDTAKFPPTTCYLRQAENEKKELLLQKFAEAADEVGRTIRDNQDGRPGRLPGQSSPIVDFGSFRVTGGFASDPLFRLIWDTSPFSRAAKINWLDWEIRFFHVSPLESRIQYALDTIAQQFEFLIYHVNSCHKYLTIYV